MKAFAAAIVVAIVLGVAAMFVLTSSQKLAYQAYATQGARVSEPGHNLVGPNWTGDPDVHDASESLKGKAEGTPSDPKRS